jgi:Chaperone of endosialidase
MTANKVAKIKFVMKNHIQNVFTALALLALTTLGSQFSTACAQGTAFTYQGRLNLAGVPANGSYDLQFILFTTNQFGSPASLILTNPAVLVNNGLFTTTLDFGAGVFTGTNYWLDISVRTNSGGTFTELSPRQPITQTPYAITAANLSGVVENNFIDAGVSLATIGGGSDNSISTGADYSTIGGGLNNEELTTLTTIGGGGGNIARADAATVGGGNNNTASGTNATVSGGGFNVASGQYATVSGGKANTAGGPYTTISGGFENTANGSGATVCGGEFNAALGSSAFAAGFSAEALHDGAFVRAAGGVGINMNNPGGASLYVQGNRSGGNFNSSVGFFENTSVATGPAGSGPALRVVCDGGSTPAGALSVSDNGTGPIAQFGNGLQFVMFIQNDGTITNVGNISTAANVFAHNMMLTSDRNTKVNFAVLDGKTVLEKVVAMPVTEWNYKADSKDVQHIGPMAQDFHAAFQLDGPDDKHISVVDEGGVALAAIQGLNQKLNEKDALIQTLKQQNDALAERLNDLETAVKQLTAQK